MGFIPRPEDDLNAGRPHDDGKDYELIMIKETLATAVETINNMQTLIAKYMHGGSFYSEDMLKAFNLGALFLSNNPKQQTEHLRKKGLIK